MVLYTQYGMILGTVDEIIEYINKQKPNLTVQGSETLQSIDDKKEVSDILSPIKIYHKCESCGYEKAEVDTSMILTSYPPQYSYNCPKCGKKGYIFTTEI